MAYTRLTECILEHFLFDISGNCGIYLGLVFIAGTCGHSWDLGLYLGHVVIVGTWGYIWGMWS